MYIHIPQTNQEMYYEVQAEYSPVAHRLPIVTRPPSIRSYIRYTTTNVSMGASGMTMADDLTYYHTLMLDEHIVKIDVPIAVEPTDVGDFDTCGDTAGAHSDAQSSSSVATSAVTVETVPNIGRAFFIQRAGTPSRR